MTPATLFAELTSSGFRLRVEAGRLLVSPASQLTPTQRQAIAQHRDALLSLVEGDTGPFEEGTLGHALAQASRAIAHWNHWERDHPQLTAAGKPRKQRVRKKPIDALAFVRTPKTETLVWNEEARRRAVQQLLEEEERQRRHAAGLT